METNSENFAKQCVIINNNVKRGNCTIVKEENFAFEVSGSNFDEPIDLTSTNRNFQGEYVGNTTYVQPSSHNNINVTYQHSNTNPVNISEFHPNPQSQSQIVHYYPANLNNSHGRFRKRRHTYTVGLSDDFQPYPVTFDSNCFQNSSSKQEEIHKAAKSLFSKRTRTLYQWMYPNAPKQQIKSAVATSWESLGSQEKDFYISQVLGRFGFPPCSLMVNPQLGGIKELPPLPDTQDFISTPQNELQNAISSISSPNSSNLGTQLSNSSFSERYQRIKKKKGRPFGSKNKKIKTEATYSMPQEFHDDPELRREFEQYALNLRQK
ncbi:unnamed protein product [Brassicogethes aeneus]|uniref:Uncharacterized protein n=1 Tax=Brassicogethes aeneus TaxID=1431903 RepID=A0A9P0B321_BRAAE|nr:unnamed protein product [Brassicogethes aeneus]